MNAAIYSAGQSIKILAAHPERLSAHANAYPLRIGINAAICYLPQHWLHWYAAGDSRCYTPAYTGHRPTAGWCCATERDREEIYACHDDWRLLPSLIWADLHALLSVPPSYSIIGALALAAHLGARAVTIYGHDAAVGKPNADGRFTDHYPPDRAGREADELHRISRVLREQGIHIHHARIT